MFLEFNPKHFENSNMFLKIFLFLFTQMAKHKIEIVNFQNTFSL